MRRMIHPSLFVLSTIAIILIGSTVQGYIGAAPAEKRQSLESRVQELEDREGIRQLLNDYGRFLDQRNFAAFSQLFAEKEGEWIGGMGKAKGSEAIRKLMEDTIGKDTKQASVPNFHLFTNEIIHVNGNQADATTKWVFVVQGGNGQPQPLYLGHYEDTFVREGGRWKFLKRTVHADIPPDETISKK